MRHVTRVQQYIERLGELFSFEPVGRSGQHLRISTPSRLPGGVPVELFLLVREGEKKLSDLGNTLDFLGTLTNDGKPCIPPPVIAELRRLCPGVEYECGEFFVRVGGLDELARAVDVLRSAVLAAVYSCWRMAPVGGTRARLAIEVLLELHTRSMLASAGGEHVEGVTEELLARGVNAIEVLETLVGCLYGGRC